MKLKVENHTFLTRDSDSKAIINGNSAELTQYRKQREIIKNQQSIIDKLQEDILEIKTILAQIVH